MKILITGGAGFIGSHVVDCYIKEGHEVIVVDNLSSGKIENLNSKAKFYLIDIRSNDLEKVFAIERPEIINHHAAQKSIPKSIESPIYDVEINIIGLLNILELCVKYSVKKFIFISSGGALAGDAKVIPTDENYDPIMISPYAITKYTGEKYLYFYSVIHSLKYVVLRYANVYGPRQIPDGECGVLPIFINNILANKESKLFAYSDMPQGTTRDYIFIEDICRANLLVLTKAENEVINIGTGKEVSTAELYATLQKITGTNLKLIKEKERMGDVRRSALNILKAKKVLNWEPQFNLTEGIRKTWEYYKK